MVLGTEYLSIPMPENFVREKFLGNFEIFEKMVENVNEKYDEDIINRLKYEIFRLNILKRNYDLTRKKLILELEKYIKDFDTKNIDYFIKNGTLDRIFINGEERFFNKSPENLHYLNKKLFENSSYNISPYKNFLEFVSRKISSGNLNNYRIEYEISINLNKNVAYKVWIPLPTENYYQKNVKILETYPRYYKILEGPHRAIYFYDTSNVFKARISLETRDINIRDGDMDSKKDLYLEERSPHVSFNRYMEKIVRNLTRNENENIKKIIKIYKHITETITFVFPRSYILYDNISEYSLFNMLGDSTMQSILLIALMRSLNIPARWRGGYSIIENNIMPHHWVEIYTEEYGFIPVDPVFGNFSLGHYYLRDFYFGNMEGLRIITSEDFNVDFSEAGKFWRIDPITNEIGEVETDSEKILDYDTKIKLINIETL
jgi:transglutaminase-like putative cysteine protease